MQRSQLTNISNKRGQMRYFSIVLLSLFFTPAFALDLDKTTVNVAYLQLPSEPIKDPNNRNFSTTFDANYQPADTHRIIEEVFYIEGFQQFTDSANIHIDFQFGPFLVEGTEVITKQRESKDKDGNVKIHYSYQPVLKYSTSANIRVNYSNGESKTYKYGRRNNTYEGSTTKSLQSANNVFRANLSQLQNSLYNKFVRKSVNNINQKLNALHGYQPITKKDSFLILDSKKYPEYNDYKQVEKDLKITFDQMTPYEPLDAIRPALESMLVFFNGIPANYPKKKRAHKKMRYASYYNAAQIYYYLDDLENALIYYQKVIENDYHEGQSKRNIVQIKKLQDLFAANQVNSRHFAIDTEIHNTENAQNFIYLDADIETKDGYNTEGKIELLDQAIDPIEALPFQDQINIKILNDNDEIELKTIAAEHIKSIQLSEHKLQSIDYVSYDTNMAQKVASGKTKQGIMVTVLAHQLYQTPKASLYSYQNEFIMKKADEELGTSTSSTAFSFGFKKKLGQYFDDCSSMQEKIKSGNYKNTLEGLTNAVNAYNDCK